MCTIKDTLEMVEERRASLAHPSLLEMFVWLCFLAHAL